MNINIVNEIEKIFSLWPTKFGLIASLILELVLMSLIFQNIKLDMSPHSHIVAILTILILTISYWFYANKIPRNPREKYGFLVSIYCDNLDTDKKFREDFIANLKSLLSYGNNSSFFNFIEINNFQAKSISTHEEAKKILDKSNSNFILYGRVSTRDKTHYLKLDSIVTHGAIPIVVSNELSKEMTELLPRKLKVNDDNFLESFEFASSWTGIASKYFIANAHLLSGDPDTALALYGDVISESTIHKNNEFTTKLSNQSKANIVIALDIKISALYEGWVNSHDVALMHRVLNLFNDYETFGIVNYNIETIKAIVQVLLNSDVDLAIEILDKFPKSAKNATWFLNKAFLFAYKRDLHSSYKQYREALNRSENEFYDGLVNKVEDFILLMISSNPDAFQLYYCLGIVNRDFKGDLRLAKTDFQNFISKDVDFKFPKESKLVSNWIEQIVA